MTPTTTETTNRLFTALTIWLVVAVRHRLRVAVIALFVLAWIGLVHGDTGDR